MPLQAFLDDSGTGSRGPSFVLAGWLAEAEAWAAFADAWSASLREVPTVDLFKMNEASRREGDFARFTVAERDQKLRKLARVIVEHVTAAFQCTLDLNGFAKTYALRGKPFRDPYFWPFHISILALCLDIYARGHTQQRFEIVFDEQMVFGPRARAWYPRIRGLALAGLKPESAILPIDPLFRSDDEFPALQAADMLAWLFRRAADQSFAVDDSGRDFAWLVEEELSKAPMSPESQWLTGPRMLRVVAAVERIEKRLAQLSQSEREGLADDSEGLVLLMREQLETEHS